MQFYIKESVGAWEDYKKNISFDEFLQENKIYTDGWLKKKVLYGIMWLLSKIDLKVEIVSADKKVMIHKITLNTDDIISLIQKNKVNLEMVWEEHPRFLVLGQKQWFELTNEKAYHFSKMSYELLLKRQIKTYDRFDSVFNGSEKYQTETLFLGIQILVIPWVDACFFLPDVI